MSGDRVHEPHVITDPKDDARAGHIDTARSFGADRGGADPLEAVYVVTDDGLSTRWTADERGECVSAERDATHSPAWCHAAYDRAGNRVVYLDWRVRGDCCLSPPWFAEPVELAGAGRRYPGDSNAIRREPGGRRGAGDRRLNAISDEGLTSRRRNGRRCFLASAARRGSELSWRSMISSSRRSLSVSMFGPSSLGGPLAQ